MTSEIMQVNQNELTQEDILIQVLQTQKELKQNQETLAIDLGTVSKIKNDIFGKYYRLVAGASLINYLKYGREQIDEKL